VATFRFLKDTLVTIPTHTRLAKSNGATAKALAQLPLYILALCCAYAYGAEPATVKRYEVTTTTFSAPAEYCVLGVELNPDVGKWMLRLNLEIPERYHFKNGDIFVVFTHPDSPGKRWFSGGELPDVPNYAPAAWYEYAQQGPVAYFSGKLNPIIPVNVMSRPTDLSSLSGGTVRIGYGIRETENSTLADSYSEMTNNMSSRSFDLPVKNISMAGDYYQYCFIVTGVKRTTACRSECLIE
jgi:hypothetical protein